MQLESELDEERRRGREVVDHDAHVVHALDRHALDDSDTTSPDSGYTSWPPSRPSCCPTPPNNSDRSEGRSQINDIAGAGFEPATFEL